MHSGPEPTRHTADVTVSKHDELDTYLPAFRAAVTEAKAGSVMCAYNSINGQPACANEFLLQDQLRGKWGFKGYVVSDCGAVIDIYDGHNFNPTQAAVLGHQPAAAAWTTSASTSPSRSTTTTTTSPISMPSSRAILKESDIDIAVTRLFTARMKLGMFDPPEMVPYTKIDEKLLDSAAHRALARKIANESMVLLKNDGVLPLSTSGIKIAVVGPLADQTKVLLGNYNGIPSHTVSILEGIRKEFAGATINYVAGTQFLATRLTRPRLAAHHRRQTRRQGQLRKARHVEFRTASQAPLVTRIEQGIDTSAAPLPAEAAGVKPTRYPLGGNPYAHGVWRLQPRR